MTFTQEMMSKSKGKDHLNFSHGTNVILAV